MNATKEVRAIRSRASEIVEMCDQFLLELGESPPDPASFVRAARARAGISQSELAQRADLDVNTVSNIETGKVEPRAGTMVRIARVLETEWEAPDGE